MRYYIKKITNKYHEELESNLTVLTPKALEELFKELSYYGQQMSQVLVDKIELEGVEYDKKFIFHEAYYSKGGVEKELPQAVLDKMFLNKNGVVTKTAHACNHFHIWYLKQLTQETHKIEVEVSSNTENKPSSQKP